MHLQLLEIENFRSVQDLRVEFQAGLNVLVGRNNTGKSTVLDAIRLALGPSSAQGDTPWLKKEDFFRSSATDGTERTIKIRLEFADLNESEQATFFEVVDFDLVNPKKSRAIIQFEASWPAGKRLTSKRTGASSATDAVDVPTAILQALPITYLPALRDAESGLAPGPKSRLARLLESVAEHEGEAGKAAIVKIFKDANLELEKHSTISQTTASLASTTSTVAGVDFASAGIPSIRAADVRLERILRSLQVQMQGAAVVDLASNGLGYNNLIYMAVVLEHLRQPDAGDVPLLMVEEPEAHLHPQLTELLARYLSSESADRKLPQTFLTTHSPTLAAAVPPERVGVLFLDADSAKPQCNSIMNAGMTGAESRALSRMLDITRATLYFSRGVILVEGISEALLVPVLAARLGVDLASLHVSVIPICGVAFGTFKKLLTRNVLGIPVALVTDRDPPIAERKHGDTWHTDEPAQSGEEFALSPRVAALKATFADSVTVRIFVSKLTLEYDLAEAADNNATVMADAWIKCFEKTPSTFNHAVLEPAGSDRKHRALVTWRGICRASHTGSKAEFAHQLAEILEAAVDVDEPVHSPAHAPHRFKRDFQVPNYLESAIRYIASTVSPPRPPSESSLL